MRLLIFILPKIALFNFITLVILHIYCYFSLNFRLENVNQSVKNYQCNTGNGVPYFTYAKLALLIGQLRILILVLVVKYFSSNKYKYITIDLLLST